MQAKPCLTSHCFLFPPDVPFALRLIPWPVRCRLWLLPALLRMAIGEFRGTARLLACCFRLTDLILGFCCFSADNPAAHAAFEAGFCDKLRQSGRDNFANANGCTFSFLNSAGKATGSLNDIQVSLKGMLQDMSPEDVTIFDKSVEAAFNEAFKKADYTISGVRAVSELDVSDVAGFARASEENVG